MQNSKFVTPWKGLLQWGFVIIAISLGASNQTCQKKGYFMADNGLCSECPTHCDSCISNTSCLLCEPGYRGEYCQIVCSNCLHGTPCDKKDGYCKESCDDGLFGEECNKRCDLKCKSCDRRHYNKGNCISCAINRHGPDCNKNCSTGCRNNTCNYNDGKCTYGCSAHYWGTNCLKPCPLQCKDNVCDNTTGKCRRGCVEGYNGSNCSFSTHRTHHDIMLPGKVLEIGLFVGLAIAAFVVVVLICLGIKRKQNRRFSDDNESYAVIQISSLNNTNHPVPLFSLSTINRRKDVINQALQADLHHEMPNAIVQQRVLEVNPEDTHEIEYSAENDDQSIHGCGEEAYYNTSSIKRKIAIDKLADYSKQKTTQEFIDEFKNFFRSAERELPRGLIKPYKESQKEENVRKNRYRGFYPYDHTRVIIKDGDSDFINASYIDGYQKLRAYIASLAVLRRFEMIYRSSCKPFLDTGPTKEFMGDISVFWKMIWQENCGKIVMLTNLQESQICKCDKYWPDKGLSDLYSDFIVSCHKEWSRKQYIVRFFSIQKNMEKREIVQFHFTAWPDKGIPVDIQSLVSYREEVNNFKTDLNGPVLVHCSAGVGRTGTYIALDLLTREGEAEGCIDIFACVRNLREQRVKMVQTAEQYEFLHHALVYSLNRQPVYASCVKKKNSETDNM